jgi:hypothetical protein
MGWLDSAPYTSRQAFTHVAGTPDSYQYSG